MRRHCVLLLIGLLVSAGCYRYVPDPAPAPGTEVRLRLTNEAALRRGDGSSEPQFFMTGRVVPAAGPDLALEVVLMQTIDQFSRMELRDTMAVARQEIQTLERRELSPGRTVLFSTAVAAATYLTIRGAVLLAGGGEGEEEGPGPIQTLIPSFNLQIGGVNLRLRPAIIRGGGRR